MKNIKKFEDFSVNADEVIVESFLGFGKNADEKREDTLNTVMKHPHRSKLYKDVLSKNKEHASSLLDFWSDNKDGMPVWSTEGNEKGAWVDKANYRASGHMFGSGS